MSSAFHSFLASYGFSIPDGQSLALLGRTLTAGDRRVLGAFGAYAAVALEQQRLTAEAQAARPIAEADRMRTALLTAVSHDLRTPLASAKAAVTSLRSPDVQWTAEDREELLATADESLDKLTRLVVKSRGWPSNLSRRERAEVKRIVTKLDLHRVAREIVPKVVGRGR